LLSGLGVKTTTNNGKDVLSIHRKIIQLFLISYEETFYEKNSIILHILTACDFNVIHI